ncbi:MAG: FxLYD domain-containing protein [Deltaproteobacteria bacterium]|nr:FxLYD domain-containing protein [Deltaproteobacteria bacterium]
MPGPSAPPTEVDIAEMDPASLKIPVIDYSWAYLAGGNHVQIQGTVVNGTGQPVQSVIIALLLYDETGKPIARGDTYVTPSYLIPGAKGTFSVMALINRQGVTHTRLISNAQTTSVY